MRETSTWHRCLTLKKRKPTLEKSSTTKYVAVVITLSICIGASSFEEWGYDKINGPNTWGQNYSKCIGEAQSPINIMTMNATIDNNLPIFDRSLFYDLPTELAIHNNGRTILITLIGGNIIPASARLLPFEVKVAQYHLHWGSLITQGSEHQLNGKRYFGEVHIVCYNTKYGSLEAAEMKNDGLALFAFFIKKGYPQRNLAFHNLLEKSLRFARNKGRMIENVLPKFSIESILPPQITTYYRYNGSRTIPSCDESVTWTVFEEPIMISDKQAEMMSRQFYASSRDSNKYLVNNYRPTQALNGRVITRPRPVIQKQEGKCSKSTKLIPNSFPLLATIFVMTLHLSMS